MTAARTSGRLWPYVAASAAAAALACGGPAPHGGSSGAAALPDATEFAVDPMTADIAVGASFPFTALVGWVPEGRVSWRVEEGSAGGSIDSNGMYTAPASAGTFHVTATSFVDSQTATAVVNVKRGGAIGITPNPARVLPSGSVSFTAIVTGLSDPRVRWSVAEGGEAGGFGAGGTYYARSAGVFHVVATSVADSSVTAVAEVHVTAVLVDLGGPIIAAPAVRALWWGARQDFGDAADVVEAFLAAVDGSPWLAVLDQYLRGAKARVAFSGDLLLPGAPSVPQPAIEEVISAVCAALDASQLAPDPGTIHLVFTLTQPAQGQRIGWHGYGSCHGVTIGVAWISRAVYAAVPAGCSSASAEAQAAVSVASHELAESMTDPFARRAWVNWGHGEVADGCPIACVNLGGVSYTVPSLWSNAAGHCVTE